MKFNCTCADVSKKMNDSKNSCIVCEVDWESLRK